MLIALVLGIGAVGGEIVDLQFVERFLDGRPELREPGELKDNKS